jgi:hypothetical protein
LVRKSYFRQCGGQVFSITWIPLLKPIFIANIDSHINDLWIECCVRYGTAVPDTLDQLIFGDDPVGVLRKVEEQVEYLQLHVNDNAVAAPELPSVGVEQEFIELKQHFVRLS